MGKELLSGMEGVFIPVNLKEVSKLVARTLILDKLEAV